jgi:gentisate 1,2-dioxygenase
MAFATRDDALPLPYSQALESLSLGPLWTALHVLLPHQRVTAAVPHRWSWREVRPLLHEAARLVPLEQAERRVLVLENPGLPGSYAVTSTLYAGLQIILPGEAAPSHHHTPSALRLVVEGDGAFTTVDGVKCAMERGDFIITPPMRWHDHGHEGTGPMVWLDGLDIPLVRAFDASWVSRTRPAQPPTATKVEGYPQLRWPWRTVREALATKARAAPAAHPVTFTYAMPTTGAGPLPTMGVAAHWLRAGEHARAGRSTAGRVFHVIEGHGSSTIGDTKLTWETGDTFVAPPWHWIEHENGSGREPACLFWFSDEPALRALGLYAEESAP